MRLDPVRRDPVELAREVSVGVSWTSWGVGIVMDPLGRFASRRVRDRPAEGIPGFGFGFDFDSVLSLGHPSFARLGQLATSAAPAPPRFLPAPALGLALAHVPSHSVPTPAAAVAAPEPGPGHTPQTPPPISSPPAQAPSPADSASPASASDHSAPWALRVAGAISVPTASAGCALEACPSYRDDSSESGDGPDLDPGLVGS